MRKTMLFSMRLRRASLDPLVRIPVVCFLATMALLVIQRLVILVTSWGLFTGFSWGNLSTSLAVGLRFDVVISCLVMILVWIPLLIIPSRFLRRRWFRRAVVGYVAAGLCTVLLLCIVDFFFFREIEERLNHKAIQYFQTGYIYESIWRNYPVIPVLLLLIGGLYVLFRLLSAQRVTGRFHRSSQSRGLLFMLAAAPLLLLGVRNSVGNKAINTGPAYFSDSPLLAQLTLNGLFTLREAVISVWNRHVPLSTMYELLPEQEALTEAQRLLAAPGDTFLQGPGNPLRRVTDTGRPQENYNVVLVLMESLSWHYISAMGGQDKLTPNLNALIGDGLLMDRCFAVGTRTTRGISGVVCGHPDLPGRGVTTRIENQGNFFTLAHVMKARGYRTMFVNGGQAMEDHQLPFLHSNGYDHLVFQDDFRHRTFRTKMGWCDEDLFDQALDELEVRHASAPDQPFFATLLTISFHQPYLIPDGRIEPVDPTSDHFKCVQYTDWAIGRFIDRMRQTPYFDRTIFVFVADHMGGFLAKPVTPASFRVPFLIYAPAILGHRNGQRISTVCSQTDVAPTIVDLLGGSYTHTFFGSSILERKPESGMALMRRGETLFFMNHDGQIASIPPYGAPLNLLSYTAPNPVDALQMETAQARAHGTELRRRGIALLQAAETVAQRGTYNLGGSRLK